MAESKPVTVYHPVFAGDSAKVAAADVEAWLAAGWRKTPLKGE